MESELKKKIVKFLIRNNVLVDSTILGKISDPKIIEKLQPLLESGVAEERKIREIVGHSQADVEDHSYKIKITKSYEENFRKKCVQDFVCYFGNRHKKLSSLLQKKQELQEATSIKRVKSKNEKENVSVIGLIYEKAKTKNGNIIFTLEDPTDQITVIVHKNKPDLLQVAEDCVLDECVGILGTYSKGAIFANAIIFPDIPATKELKKGKEECYAAFTGDPHVGSKQFFGESFSKLIDWLSGNIGSEEQKNIAKKTKYLFIVGDLVDGLGIYPTQYQDLEIKDVV
ncbi:hypothetical protein KY308_02800 [Candidatus Woesearchaeota archaeon]|nr:hypothetical protein [Candidatus Woesearchaeota archaeon]